MEPGNDRARHGSRVATPRITRSADALSGRWSVGKADQNPLVYIASITYEYMGVKYRRANRQ